MHVLCRAESIKIIKSNMTDVIFEKLKMKEEFQVSNKQPTNFYIGAKKKKIPYGREVKLSPDYDYEETKTFKDDHSDEELITEEMFQKALKATLEQEAKNKAKSGRKKKSMRTNRKSSSKNRVFQQTGASLILNKYKNMKRKESGYDTSKVKKNFSMDYDNIEQFKPLCTALPMSMPQPPTIADRIRAAKRLHMTRRDMTEQKIIKNIMIHNDPSDMQNFEVLYVSNKNYQL